MEPLHDHEDLVLHASEPGEGAEAVAAGLDVVRERHQVVDEPAELRVRALDQQFGPGDGVGEHISLRLGCRHRFLLA